MAKIRNFFKATATVREHPTEVDCGWQVSQGPVTLLQLSTYGSDQRASQPKVSQTLQLDEAGARELLTIIQTAFPQLGRD